MSQHSQLPADLKRYSAEAHVKQQPELRERRPLTKAQLLLGGIFILAAYGVAGEMDYQDAVAQEQVMAAQSSVPGVVPVAIAPVITAIPVFDRAKPGCTQYNAKRDFSTEPWLVREVPCGRVRK